MSINSFDLSLFSVINQTLSNDFFDVVMPVIRNKNTWIPLYLLIAFLILKKNSKEFFLLGFFVLLAFVMSDSMICNTIKILIHRPRPCNELSMIPHMHLLLKNCSGGFSFPSAHACNHATLAFMFGHYFLNRVRGWAIFILFIFWALAIAFAQVYVGVHYPSDVITGFILGSFNGIFFYYLYTKANNYFHHKQKQSQ